MSDLLDLRLPGNAASCRSAATEISGAASSLDGLSSTLSTLVGRAERAWTGTAADGFTEGLHDTRKDVDAVVDRLEALGRALDTFASELDVVHSTLADVRADAAAAGLRVGTESVHAPDALASDATESETTQHDTLGRAWNTAVGAVQDARLKETSAHDSLSRALDASSGDGWLEQLLGKLGFAPPDHGGTTSGALWGLDRLGLAFSSAGDWMIKGRYGIFQPRIAGRFASPSAFSAWQRGLMSLSDKNWHALPHAADARAAWSTAGKWAGRAGVAVSFATAAWDQWSEDADDPTLSTSERTGRTVVVGATTAAAAWGGAWVGAQAGGAIGTMICPGVGTVIGGAVGGLIGGIAGSELGGAVGDLVKDAAGKATEAVTDFVGDAASDLGDALTFWD